ncbi:MAG: hypothetical protein U0Q22_00275 [Acidimicrobiales bacterium]
MNHHTDDAVPEDDLTQSGDEPIDARLGALLSDVEPAAPDRRRAHLDAALAVFDELSTDQDDRTLAPVADLTAARHRSTGRRRNLLPIVAAAAVAVVIVGVGLRLITSGTSKDDAMSTAAGSSASTAAPTADASADASATLAPNTTESGEAATKQQSTDAAGAPLTTLSPAPGPLAATAQVAPVPLGEVADAAALRAAVAGAVDGFGTDRTAVDGGAGATSPPTTLDGRCDAVVAGLAFPRFSARLGGRDVIAAPTTSSTDGPIEIVHLDDCSRSPL